MLQLAINYVKPGDIIAYLPVNTRKPARSVTFLASACLAKGIGGLVTDTGVRNASQLRDLGLPVFSLSACIKGTVRETLGTLNDSIDVGGEIISPCDIAVGDADGLVVRREEAQEAA